MITGDNWEINCKNEHGGGQRRTASSAMDVEVAIKSLTLASKRYCGMNVADGFGDIYCRAP